MTENKVLPISYPRKSKINLYIEEMISKLNRIYPDLEEDKIKEIVIKKVKEDYAKKAPTVKVDDNIIPIHTMDKYILEENLLVTGSGSLYQQHEGSLNLNVEIIKFLKRERNKYKGLMFKAMEESKIALYERNDVNQKVFKLFNNSFYGVQTQENSIFFNPESGPSITQSGQDIITTSVITFERFLTGNIFMENINDAFIYVDNILNEKDPEIKINIKMIPTINIVLEWLLSKVDYYSIEDKEKLNRFLSTLTDKELLRVYYKNNLIKLIENSDIYENYISKFVVRDDFTDPNKPPKDLIEDINEYWSIVRDYVFYNYSDYYRFRNMFSSNERKRLRRAVLTIDTDSNFLYLNPLVKIISKKLGFEDDSDLSLDERISIVNTLMYININVINETYIKYMNGVGANDIEAPTIKMDNEFYMSRIMLTRNKKNYASTVILRESRKVPENKQLDLKGLAIRKVNTNKKARKLFEEILELDILKSKKINLPEISSKYRDFEKEIFDSLRSGSTEYAAPGKVNTAASYKDPYSIASYKGTIIWNKLFPKNKIEFPSRINMIKLKIESIEDIYNSDIEDESIIKVFEEIMADENLLVGNKKNKTTGKIEKLGSLNGISLPQNIKEVPDFLIPFIDIDTIINNTISPGLILLESLGFRMATTSTSIYPTNIVRI